MKIALVSKRTSDNNIEFNTDQIVNTVDQLKNGVDLICFGEAFLQGFNSLNWSFDTDKNIAVAADGDVISKIRAKAKEHGVAVAFGYFERDGKYIYSSYIVIGKDGQTVTDFRRVSKGWKEYTITDGHYREGEGFCSFDYLGKKLAIAVCGDLWEEDLLAAIAETNADMLLYPVYITYELNEFEREIKQEYVDRLSVVGFPAAMINSVCAEDGTLGGCYFVKDGKIVSALDMGKEGVLLIEV